MYLYRTDGKAVLLTAKRLKKHSRAAVSIFCKFERGIFEHKSNTTPLGSHYGDKEVR